MEQFREAKKLEPNWPSEVDPTKFHAGFRGATIEDLVSLDRGFGEGKKIPSPVIFWTSENSSYGKCFRDWLDWSNLLPIPFGSDHGVHLQRKLEPLEVALASRYHLTWSKWRKTEESNRLKKTIVHIPHPWIHYRLTRNVRKSKGAFGTLVFLPHSWPDAELVGFNIDKYIAEIDKLPEAYKPLVLCLPMHDVRKGIHINLARLNLPMVTLGNTSSPFFVDRFYDLVRKFQYATSTSLGTQMFFCQELGVDYFLLGDPPKVRSKDEQKVNFIDSDLSLQISNAFSLENLREMETKLEIVKDALGLNVDGSAARSLLSKVMKRELIRLLPKLLSAVADHFRRKPKGIRAAESS
jgi:hypothetical protein